MWEALAMLYLWLKAGHVIFVIFWVAGLFMLPRFFVYHQETAPGSPEAAAWVERERRLLRIILLPAILLVWAFGLTLAVSGGWFAHPWLHAKLLFVLILSAYHGWLAGYARKLARGERAWSGGRLRLVNEVPGALTVVVVVLAIVKPFG